MTIDEAIVHARKESERWLNERFSTMDNLYSLDYCKKKSEEHEQLAEWLEEYKWLKKQKEMLDPFNFALVCARKESYKKAIDNFVCYMCSEFDSKNKDIEEHTGEYVVKRVHSIAEQLKEGAGE